MKKHVKVLVAVISLVASALGIYQFAVSKESGPRINATTVKGFQQVSSEGEASTQINQNGKNNYATNSGNIYIQEPKEISVLAERFTNIQKKGQYTFVDYLMVNLHPDGTFDVKQSKSAGVNMSIPEDLLYKIEGKWIVEESDVNGNPNTKYYKLSEIGVFSGRKMLEIAPLRLKGSEPDGSPQKADLKQRVRD